MANKAKQGPQRTSGTHGAVEEYWRLQRKEGATTVLGPLTLSGKEYAAVHSGKFDSIGIVRQDNRVCQTCTSNNKKGCEHSKALRGGNSAEPETPFMASRATDTAVRC